MSKSEWFWISVAAVVVGGLILAAISPAVQPAINWGYRQLGFGQQGEGF